MILSHLDQTIMLLLISATHTKLCISGVNVTILCSPAPSSRLVITIGWVVYKQDNLQHPYCQNSNKKYVTNVVIIRLTKDGATSAPDLTNYNLITVLL